jgi:hypothetical protein
MFEDPNAPPTSDPTGGGSGSGGGITEIDGQSSIQGYTAPEDPDPTLESGTTDTTKVMPDSDPTGGGSGSGGG